MTLWALARYRPPPIALAGVLAGKPAPGLRRSGLEGVPRARANLTLGALLAGPPSAASHPNLWLWGGLVLLAYVVYQVVACWAWPYKNCRRCSGSGKRPAMFGGSAFKTCGRCSGTGKRVRTGRRAVDQFRDVKARAK